MISLATTVLNNRKDDADFLNAICKQTRRADEIVIVDGGSLYGTLWVKGGG